MANLTREEAWELVKEYNKDPFHLRHALTVEGVMRWYANELGYGDEANFWALAGITTARAKRKYMIFLFIVTVGLVFYNWFR